LSKDILEVNNKTNNKGDFYEKVDHYKKNMILEALEKHEWVQKKAATQLGLKATTLSELMKRLEIQK
jgi:transcriptional regulator with GAF, ATPase, and Fis domain